MSIPTDVYHYNEQEEGRWEILFIAAERVGRWSLSVIYRFFYYVVLCYMLNSLENEFLKKSVRL